MKGARARSRDEALRLNDDERTSPFLGAEQRKQHFGMFGVNRCLPQDCEHRNWRINGQVDTVLGHNNIRNVRNTSDL